MTENYALLGGSIKIDPTDFDASLIGKSVPNRLCAMIGN